MIAWKSVLGKNEYHGCCDGRIIRMQKDPSINKWLMELAKHIEVWFNDLGYKLGNYTVLGTHELDNDFCGLCYEDNYYRFCEIYVDVATDQNEILIINILAHEMIHAVLGAKKGHRYHFRKLAKDLGVILGNHSTKIDREALLKGTFFNKRANEIISKVGCFPTKELCVTA